MTTITIEHFDKYFHELHGHSPYPWQRRLAEQVVADDWPGAIDLPTGSGKTACLDAAVFALACQAALPVEQRSAPRRIFFCVNRRVIVDEACQRARRIAQSVWEAERKQTTEESILRDVAAALREVGGTCAGDKVPPLDVIELRGGIYRDNRWARSITQPTIICTTLDQLGSRLLFRGYGVSPNAAPIQAALIAYDSLILLDEAHISEPFRQTLEFVTRYLDPEKWAEQPICVKPAIFVPMTATPNDAMKRHGVIQLEKDDRAVEALNNRLTTSKPAKLRQVTNVAEGAVDAAIELAADGPVAVGIIVNRVATARKIYEKLRERRAEPNEKKRKMPADVTIELVIGSMRPIDRDQQAERLSKLVGPGRPKPHSTQTSFVVATQCLEVGADYDFDALVTECASLDALRQRFGRLNRAGREIEAKAIILACAKEIKPDDKLDDDKPLDPIYGNALARIWNWLSDPTRDGVIDFGIDAFGVFLNGHGENGQPPKNLLAPAASLNAPVMMPAYVDLWCQTSPQPVPDPDVSLFIHGPGGAEPDVQVCWRADIGDTPDHPPREDWCDVVALLPPTSAECMRVPIFRVRRWLVDRVEDDLTGDALGLAEGEDETSNGHGREMQPAVLWRGAKDSRLLQSPRDLRPGDTLVLPAEARKSYLLGHLPELFPGPDDDPEQRDTLQVADHAESAFRVARDRVALRLHPALSRCLPDTSAVRALLDAAKRHCAERVAADEWRKLVSAAIPDFAEHAGESGKTQETLKHLAAHSLRVESYPDQGGVLLTSRERLGSTTDWFIPSLDDGDDDTSRVQRDKPVLLSDHAQHVRTAVETMLEGLSLGNHREAFVCAADLHDLGKADERFQAMLRRTDRTDAWLLAGAAPALLAKSDGAPQTAAQRREARERAELPEGFRHEMLSVQLAEHMSDLPAGDVAHDLILHLIAAHHGHARPFAPIVPDNELPTIELDGMTLSYEQRKLLIPPHRLDSGIPERFWRLTRRFGWWGLAYLEAVLRLADQQASADEDARDYDNAQTNGLVEAHT